MEPSPDVSHSSADMFASAVQEEDTTSTPSPLAPTVLFPPANGPSSTEREAAANSSAGYLCTNYEQVTLNMDHVRQEMNEVGDTDSVSDSSEVEELNSSTEEAARDRLMVLIKKEDDVESNVVESDKNYFCLKFILCRF